MNYAAVAVVIMLVSIVYEFTVVSWVIAAQEHKEDERARSKPIVVREPKVRAVVVPLKRSWRRF